MGGVRLTPAQERTIREARARGAGYRAIAAAVGLERDTVRYFCKRHGLDGDQRAAGNDAQENTPCCPACGQPIAQPPRGRRRRFCSDACRRAWWAKHPEALHRGDAATYSRTCACCGKTFQAYGNDHRRYCSHACYISDRFHKAGTDGRTVIRPLS